jgi:hypothetical protein
MTRVPSSSGPILRLRRYIRGSVLPPALRYRMLLRKTPDMAFIWIPKTAGSSLFVWLNGELGMLKLKEPEKYRAFPGYGAVTFSHCHYLSLREAGYVSDAFHNRAFRFSVVRNPYWRAVSLYRYLKVHNIQYPHSFVEFLDEVYRHRPPVGLYNVRGLSQCNPQMDWLQDADGQMVADHIYRIDDLDQLQLDIAARFGPAKNPIPRRNTSRSQTSPLELLTKHSESVPLIKQIYSRDFDVLGFSYDLPEDT